MPKGLFTKVHDFFMTPLEASSPITPLMVVVILGVIAFMWKQVLNSIEDLI